MYVEIKGNDYKWCKDQLDGQKQRIVEIIKCEIIEHNGRNMLAVITAGNTMSYTTIKEQLEKVEACTMRVFARKPEVEWRTELKEIASAPVARKAADLPPHMIFDVEDFEESTAKHEERKIPDLLSVGVSEALKRKMRKILAVETESWTEYTQCRRQGEWLSQLGNQRPSIIPFIVVAKMCECKFTFVEVKYEPIHGEVNKLDKELWEMFPDSTWENRQRALLQSKISCEPSRQNRTTRDARIKEGAWKLLKKLKTSRSLITEGDIFDPGTLPDGWLSNSMEESFKPVVTIGGKGGTYYVGCKGSWLRGECFPMIKEGEKYLKWQMLEEETSAYSTILSLFEDGEHGKVLRVLGGSALGRDHNDCMMEVLQTEAMDGTQDSGLP